MATPGDRPPEGDRVLPPRKQKAIEALISEHTVSDAAKKIGVSEPTLYRWMRDDAFRSELRAAQREVWAALTRKLTSSGVRAIETLHEIAGGKPSANLPLMAYPPAARVAAAKAILAGIFKFIVAGDVEERLERLEQQAELET